MRKGAYRALCIFRASFCRLSLARASCFFAFRREARCLLFRGNGLHR